MRLIYNDGSWSLPQKTSYWRHWGGTEQPSRLNEDPGDSDIKKVT